MKHNTVTVLSFAKINLTLDITGKLSNGYHTVDMVMQTVSLSDKITVEKLDIQTENIFLATNAIPLIKLWNIFRHIAVLSVVSTLPLKRIFPHRQDLQGAVQTVQVCLSL